MEHDETLVVHSIGQLVTLDAARGDILGMVHNATLVARGGIITDILTEEEEVDWNTLPHDVTEIDANGAAVVPGFVDCHTHLAWLGNRREEYVQRANGVSYEDIAASGGGIRSTIEQTKRGSPEKIAHAMAGRLATMLASGTTTAEVKSGYGGSLAGEEKQLQAVKLIAEDSDRLQPECIATFLPLHGAVPDAQERAQWIREVVTDGLARMREYATFVDVFCEEGAYSPEECMQVLGKAQEHGYHCKIHAEQRSHSGGSMVAAYCHATSADHLDHATDRDADALRAADVVGVLLPGASLILDGPPPPGRMLMEHGVELALATDCNPGTCYAESMPLMMSLAVAYAGLTPEAALRAATLGGAHALRLQDRGMIAPGMRADLLVLETPSWIDLSYHMGASLVQLIVQNGRIIPRGLTHVI